MIESFPPIAGDKPKVLILGSMPSVKSLEFNQYYGHPRNHFWPILFKIFHKSVVENHVDVPYQEKVDLITGNNLAVWDVLSSCEREGSLDSDIKEEVPNEIRAFLEAHKEVKVIVFNGGKAESSFKKFFKDLYRSEALTFMKMPSTSPAYTLKYASKLEAWKQIQAYATF